MTMFTKRPVLSPPAVVLPAFADPSVPSRACCCPARPAVKVTMPKAKGRPRPVDLWLCGHHYRASLAALERAGAKIEDLGKPWAPSEPDTDHAAAMARP